MARRYEIIAGRLDDAGFGWYEVSITGPRKAGSAAII